MRDWAIASRSAYILTGGFFYDPAEENPNTADGIIDYSTIGPGTVAVPTHFYKIVVTQDGGGHARAIAFVAENRRYSQPFDFAALIKSIDWIEERTGLNFMPDLFRCRGSDAREHRVAYVVKRSLTPACRLNPKLADVLIRHREHWWFRLGAHGSGCHRGQLWTSSPTSGIRLYRFRVSRWHPRTMMS